MIGWVSLYEVLAFMDKHIQRPKIKTFLLAPPPPLLRAVRQSFGTAAKQLAGQKM